MSSLPEEPSPVKRFACDRCHGQKLRCPRLPGGGPCTRCEKARVRCHVSAAQRTGRPAQSNPRKGKQGVTVDCNAASAQISGSSSEDGSSEDAEMGLTKSWGSASSLTSPQMLASTGFGMQSAPLPAQLSTDTYFDYIDYNCGATFLEPMDLHELPEANFFSNFTTSTPTVMNTTALTSRPIVMECHTEQDSGLQSRQTSMSLHDSMAIAHKNLMLESNMPNGRSAEAPMAVENMRKEEARPTEVMQQMPNTPSNMSRKNLSSPDLREIGDSSMSFSRNMNKRKRLCPSTMSDPTNNNSQNFHLDLSKSTDFSPSQALSRLQMEVDNFSERMVRQARGYSGPLGSYASETQNISEDLGVILSAADRFIKIVSGICLPSTVPCTPGPVQSPWIKPQASTTAAMQSLFHIRPRSTTEMRMFSLDSSTGIDGGQSFDSGTFHLMLVCHTRLLFAFDATLDAVLQRLLDQENADASSAMFTSNFSIGSYVIPNGTVLETLLHLQAISHQLDRLGTTLRSHLPKSQPHREIEESRFSFSPRPFFQEIFCRQRRAARHMNSVSDSALEEIGEREGGLQTKIAQIANLANNSHMLQMSDIGSPQGLGIRT